MENSFTYYAEFPKIPISDILRIEIDSIKGAGMEIHSSNERVFRSI